MIEKNSDFAANARQVRSDSLGDYALLRSVIEFSNRCHRNCSYCGMRAANTDLVRYDLTVAEIVQAAERAVLGDIGIVMLQAGDNLTYDVGALSEAVSHIERVLDVRVLLCVGDRNIRDYRRLFAAGARQAIVKFETSNADIYKRLRPHNTLGDRLRLIEDLHQFGYSISSGFIQGLPGTSEVDLCRDIELTSALPLFAASVSPFIPSAGTPLGQNFAPRLEEILRSISMLRINGPSLLIPSVSALGMLSRRESSTNEGQIAGLLSGANVLTVNYTPLLNQKSYVIYDKDRWVVDLKFAKDSVRLAGLKLVGGGAQIRPLADLPFMSRQAHERGGSTMDRLGSAITTSCSSPSVTRE